MASKYLTLRLDELNSRAKEVGSMRHESQLGLTLREVRLIILIADETGININSLVENSFLERTIVSRTVTKLCQSGLVRRVVNDKDARQTQLFLTPEGVTTAQKAKKLSNEGVASMLATLTPYEREVFELSLEKVLAKVLTDLEEEKKKQKQSQNVC
ncbi:Multidrug resistance operon repressor [Marinomonas spartinae]|uniref:Multidrug resistance operon repressor n=1 Tax=Marinomonas spartinae TaxID=1792290 RepID=A0A1A8T3A7_9GAMM|nr:MarR family transcriptional regulator [Marinomonas spartinae]SBS25530.1 Multidrug resistance operon repressor [Marinomonas spartinae]SBS39608.1 Multidrug resistance operon repressor [Marinomonas spartinae]